MDRTRAKQIIEAEQNIDVLYHGSPVWIEGVSDNNIAEVTALTGRRTRMEVPVTMLTEKLQ